MGTYEAWLNTITERVSDSIIVLDEKRIIRFANDAAARMAGVREAQQLVGVSYTEIVKSHTVRNEDGSIAEPQTFPSEIAFREGKETRNKIFSQIDPRGVHHWLSVTSFPLPERADNVRCVAVIYEDISRRKLREDRLRFLIESSKILSINTDLHARLREKTRLLIPTLADWATVNLVSEDGVLHRVALEHRDRDKIPHLERFASIAAEDEDAVIYRVAKTGVSELFPLLSSKAMQRPDRSEEYNNLIERLRPCSAMIVPIGSASRVLGVLSLAFSDSGRQYTQEDVEFMEEFGHHLSITIDNARLYAEIAKRDGAKDAFLATLSHELRNPLAPIKSSIELLRIKNSDETIRNEIEVIEHQFGHMEKLLRDLLDVTRFTLGKVKLQRTSIDVSTVARAVADMRRGAIERKGIKLSLTAPEEPLWISADALRIEQVFTNILSNAEKFTPADGRIAVSLKELAHNVIITISDTGVGIPPEEIGRVFDQYFQGLTSFPHSGSGLGMGLVLVREIVKLHGGSVYVESAGKGAGSTFTITLPLERTAQHTHSEESSSRAQQQGKILVIDDNKDAADSLVKLLSAVGYEATAAYSGTQGLGLFQETTPQYVIIDIGMPDINGYHVAKKLREKHGRRARLIALSGYGMEEDKRRAREAGFDNHLTKPVGLADLRSVLETTPS